MRTYSQMQGDETVPSAERERRLIDEALGLTAHVLLQRGQRAEADAMLRIVRTSLEGHYDFSTDYQWLIAEYEPNDEQFIKSHEANISNVFREVCQRKGYGDEELCGALEFREVLPDVGFGWREQIAEILHGKKRTNQARIVREENPRWAEDGLYFTNPGELRVYRALKRMQEDDFPKEDTIAIFPLARGRIPGYTREPDFIVTYRGRAGVLEVDSFYHDKRRSLDISSEHLYRDAGVFFIDRIEAQAVDNPEELHATLKRFIRRLCESR